MALQGVIFMGSVAAVDVAQHRFLRQLAVRLVAIMPEPYAVVPFWAMLIVRILQFKTKASETGYAFGSRWYSDCKASRAKQGARTFHPEAPAQLPSHKM